MERSGKGTEGYGMKREGDYEERRKEERGKANHSRIRQEAGRVRKEDGMSGKEEERRAGCEMRKRVREGTRPGGGRRGEDDIDRLKKMSLK